MEIKAVKTEAEIGAVLGEIGRLIGRRSPAAAQEGDAPEAAEEDVEVDFSMDDELDDFDMDLGDDEDLAAIDLDDEDEKPEDGE